MRTIRVTTKHVVVAHYGEYSDYEARVVCVLSTPPQARNFVALATAHLQSLRLDPVFYDRLTVGNLDEGNIALLRKYDPGIDAWDAYYCGAPVTYDSTEVPQYLLTEDELS